MKILNLAQFLELPPGAVFCKYKPSFFEEFRVKGESLSTRDFVYCSLWDVQSRDSGHFGEQCDAAERGESVPLEFDEWARDGCFDDEQMFAVFEAAELGSMAARLTAPGAAVGSS